MEAYRHQSSQALLHLWTRSYGNGLADDDLDQILAYYKPPIGQKDVAATKAAYSGFTAAILVERGRRLQSALDELIASLNRELSTP
jgi:hypothetical protein